MNAEWVAYVLWALSAVAFLVLVNRYLRPGGLDLRAFDRGDECPDSFGAVVATISGSLEAGFDVSPLAKLAISEDGVAIRAFLITGRTVFCLRRRQVLAVHFKSGYVYTRITFETSGNRSRGLTFLVFEAEEARRAFKIAGWTQVDEPAPSRWTSLSAPRSARRS